MNCRLIPGPDRADPRERAVVPKRENPRPDGRSPDLADAAGPHEGQFPAFLSGKAGSRGRSGARGREAGPDGSAGPTSGSWPRPRALSCVEPEAKTHRTSRGLGAFSPPARHTLKSNGPGCTKV